MCKLIAISGLSVKGRKQSNALIKKTSELLGSSQRDGYGFAIGTGNVADMSLGVYIERYLNPSVVTGMGTIKSSRTLLPSSIKTVLKDGVDFDSHGIMPSGKMVNAPFIAHGRTATCGKFISNTHPFTGKHNGKQWTIAHNGVVEWNGDKLPLHTTCDSEYLLNCYLYLNGEQSFKDGIAGYAAIVGINPEGEMFALRDDRAPLYVQYILELENYVVCTDPLHCDVISKMLCEFMGIKTPTVTDALMLEPYVAHTFHANGLVSSNEFTPFKSSMTYGNISSVYRSLGSAGAIGYSGGNWDDDYVVSPYTKTVASITTPATPPVTPPVPSTPAPALDEAEKQQAQVKQQMLKNSKHQQKPWKK